MPLSVPHSYNDNENSLELTQENKAIAWLLARDNIENAQHVYKYFHVVKVRRHDFKIGQTVYIHSPTSKPGQVRRFCRSFKWPY